MKRWWVVITIDGMPRAADNVVAAGVVGAIQAAVKQLGVDIDRAEQVHVEEESR